MDDDPEEGVMLRSDFTLTTQIHRTASFLSLSSRITEALVRYDLGVFLRTIRSRVSFMYDINLRPTATTILSIRGVQIPIYLVTSATDSLGKRSTI